MQWKSIEDIVISEPIWVMKYTLYQRTIDGVTDWCKKEDPGAEAFTDCHGYYDSEEDAKKVLAHFPKPHTYKIEKVYKRRLKALT